MTNVRQLLLTLAALSILPGAIARADSISIAFDSSTLSAQPGQTITFSGTITNLEGSAVYLNACGVIIPGQFTGDCSPLYNGPIFLDPFGSAAFDMFTITVDEPYTDPLGLQPGTFTVVGGVDGDAQDNLVQAEFSVDVVPEPGTAVLLGLALTLTFALWRRNRHVEG